jgi:3'(2'), 5'-bisphosphate nucleotidase
MKKHSMNYKQLLLLAVNASIDGGKEIMKIYESDFSVELKDDNSPLTLADRKCNDIIEKVLTQTQIPILSEEGAAVDYNERKLWDVFWLVDPLDGTKEFVKRNGEFTVNIALIANGKPIMGVIYVPVKNKLYYAMDGFGSFKIQVKDNFKNLEDLMLPSIKLPCHKNKNKYVIVGSRSHMSIETKQFFEEKKKEYQNVEILAIGSSLKLCMVAEGIANAYPRYAPTMEWDTGAGHAIVNMSGFKVLEHSSGEELRYNKENLLNPWFLVI